MATRTILVVGATGQQGTAVLEALSELTSTSSSSSSPKIKILALTRSASSPKARALPSTYPGLDLELVEGNTREPGPIFAAHPDIDAVFSYTTPPDEFLQASALIDAAAASGASHFVFSSVDRGGEPRSWTTPTDIRHFREKHEAEVHLRAACEKAGGRMAYTILRPVAFMDNLNPTSAFGAFGAAFASLWGTMPAGTKPQLVSVRDIGLVGARALLAGPEGADRRYAGRAVGLAGDELSLADARAAYRRAAGQQLPQAWAVVGWGIRWALARDVGRMFRWFETDGYGVDVAALRREEPGIQDLETWLRESSRFECGRGK